MSNAPMSYKRWLGCPSPSSVPTKVAIFILRAIFPSLPSSSNKTNGGSQKSIRCPHRRGGGGLTYVLLGMGRSHHPEILGEGGARTTITQIMHARFLIHPSDFPSRAIRPLGSTLPACSKNSPPFTVKKVSVSLLYRRFTPSNFAALAVHAACVFSNLRRVTHRCHC